MTLRNKLNYYTMPGILTKRKLDELTIIEFVCKEMNVTYEDAISKDRSRSLILTRGICYAILKTYLGITLVAIARLFNRDHTTIINGLRMHKQDMQTNDIYAEQFEEIRFLLKLYIPSPKHKKNAKSILTMG